jgi:serine beta-lactamase-like protein LACTB
MPSLARAFVTAAALAVGGLTATASHPYDAAIREGRDALQQMVDRGQAPGVGVAVAVRGEIVWSAGVGFADLAHRVPVGTDTRFGLGSISKTLTMAAAMRLVDRGVLDLDAPVETYLPDFPHRGRGVTVRRLAAHQSGLSDAFAVKHYATTRAFPTLDSAYQEMKGDPLDYPPGSKVAYATGVYTIIGRVMEVASGRDYRTLMRDEVFSPAGIAPVANDPRAIIPHKSSYYANADGGGFEHAAVVNPSHKLAGAGFVATAAEVARFGAALLDPAFLSPRARTEMFTAVSLADGTPTEYALGLQVTTDTHGRVVHLPGGGLGISSWLFIYPDRHVVFALLSNVNTAPVGGRAYRRIADAFMTPAQ